jgi:hypothetical protein
MYIVQALNVHYKEIDNKRGGSLSVHCVENSKQIFSEMKLRGLAPNFYIHVSVSIYIVPQSVPLF